MRGKYVFVTALRDGFLTDIISLKKPEISHMPKNPCKIIFALLLIILGVQSCVVATKEVAIAPQISSLFEGTYKIDPYMEEHKPITVAVLPFLDKSRKKEGADAVRKGFYNHFSSLP